MLALLLAGAVLPLAAQSPCSSTPAYSTCELSFELSTAESAAHPNPYLTVQLQAEFRSPRFHTFLMPAFWDGGRKLAIRIAPTDAGPWTYRLTSNIDRFNGQTGQFTATASEAPGFLKPANLHHWATIENKQPHLWMGDTCYRFGFLDRALFDQLVEARAKQKFTHLRGLVLGWDADLPNSFPAADRPNAEYFRELDRRVLALNARGIVVDLVLGGDHNQLARLFPSWQERERYLRYLVSRYSPMNVNWELVQEFEGYEDPRELTKELGLLLKKIDPYDHLRTTHTVATSGPLAADGWMTHILYQSSDDAVGAVEHQLFPFPFVNAGFAYEDSGAGRMYASDVDSDTFRRRLWNATMDGQSPVFGNTGTCGGKKISVDAKHLDSPGARQMTFWFDFFAHTRYWELEPYFDVEGGRAVALEGVEYIVYVEKPGPVEVTVEKHGYNLAWFNPATGESFKLKEFKGDKFTGSPPDSTHDWVLHLSREGHKESMLHSYKFDSRLENPLALQEVEQNAQKVPYELVEPSGDALRVGQSIKYSLRLKRETRATSSMMYLWTAEVAADGFGYRVVATGRQGTFVIPGNLARNYPAVLNLRLAGMNARGKVYFVDRVFRLER